jgi:PAS domain S-box-containing protein
MPSQQNDSSTYGFGDVFPPMISARLSDVRFRRLFESNLIGIGTAEKNGVFLSANDALLDLLGYTRTDLREGRFRWDLLTPPEFDAIDAAGMAEAVRRGQCTPYEKEFIHKDGRRIPIIIGYAWSGELEQQFLGFVLDLTDLTARRAAEAKSEAREERFRTLAESLPQMIFTSDVKGAKTYCCPRYLEYTGVGSIAEMGAAWEGLLHPDDRQATVKCWEEALATGQNYSTEYRLRRHDGVYRYHLARAVPVRNDAGEIIEWVGAITDIHDRKQTEELLRRTEKLNAAARIAASIAHEINNPLASVTNSLYLAMQDPNLSPITRQYLRLADQELARVAHVTTQSLRFHKQSTSAVSVDVAAHILDPTLALHFRKFEAARISVHRKFTTSHKLFCRAEELRQAFGHLLSNACDAMTSGGRLFVRVRQGCDPTGTQPGIKVTIADTGTGITPDFLPHIFEAFTSTKDPTGTGLGMWVVNGIIRGHNGSIAIRSRTSGQLRGTVITTFLPFLGVTDTTS